MELHKAESELKAMAFTASTETRQTLTSRLKRSSHFPRLDPLNLPRLLEQITFWSMASGCRLLTPRQRSSLQRSHLGVCLARSIRLSRFAAPSHRLSRT